VNHNNNDNDKNNGKDEGKIETDEYEEPKGNKKVGELY